MLAIFIKKPINKIKYMITVTQPSEGSSNQKVISTFMKRTKKYNLIQRARKVKYFSRDLSHQKKQSKAIKTAAFLAKKVNQY
jgi:hypothetical protein